MVLQKVLAKIVVIDRGAAKSMDADHQHLGFVLFGDPFAVPKGFALCASGIRVLNHDRARCAGTEAQSRDYGDSQPKPLEYSVNHGSIFAESGEKAMPDGAVMRADGNDCDRAPSVLNFGYAVSPHIPKGVGDS